jgi:transcriptional regulator with XRE-family HTH domain
MKEERRIASSSLSASVVRYLLDQKHTQAEIAQMLGVSPAFISLVKARERSLTLDHLERLSLALGVPVGTLLLAVTKPVKKLSTSKRQLLDLTETAIKKIDVAREAILRDASAASR